MVVYAMQQVGQILQKPICMYQSVHCIKVYTSTFHLSHLAVHKYQTLKHSTVCRYLLLNNVGTVYRGW